MQRQTVTVYPLDNYGFGVKEGDNGDFGIFSKRIERLKPYYAVHGMAKCVEVVLLVHLHGHPHVLLLSANDSFFLYLILSGINIRLKYFIDPMNR